MQHLNRTVLDAIGNTPIIKLNKVATEVESEIYVKLEYMNPGGSVKDRIGAYMMKKAVEKGILKPGGTIIEGTSGNTGVGLAMFAAVHGYKCIFVLADKQSPEKINNLRAFGAKVIVCPTNVEPEDPRSYYSVAKRLAETIPNSFYVNQYDNPDNADTHFHTTGPEIFEQTKGQFDVIMAGIGTGGTICGTGRYLKTKMPKIKVVAVDIKGSILGPFFKTGKVIPAAPYVLEGIGEDFFPKNVDFKVIDDFVMVEDKECFLMTRRLLTEEGIYSGGSCGGAVVGAIRYAKTLKEPKKILVILPDSGNRYTSKIYNDDWMRERGYLDTTFNVAIRDVVEDLGKGQKEIVTITEKSTVGEAVKIMEKHGISQVPVCSGNDVIGIVTEGQILRPVFEGKLSLNDTVSVAYGRNFQVFEMDEMLDKVSSALVKKDVALIKDGNRLMAILTDIDVLNFITKKK